MEQLHTLTERALAALNINGTVTWFGNTLGEYAFALVVFLFVLAIAALGQFFLLQWAKSFSERTKTDLDDAFVKMAQSFKPPFYLVLAFWLALQSLTVTGVASQIVTAVLVLWVVYQLVVIVGILVEDIVFRHLTIDDDPTTGAALHLLVNIAKGVMWVIGILMVLSNFGINVTSLMAGAGIAGIAIAFALQGILSDLFSSFSIFFDKPFRVGDFVIVGETMGVVEHIGVKSTRIRALAGEEITVSNQELTSARIQNYGRMEERRISFSIGILYETPVEQVREVPGIVKGIVEGNEKARFDRAHFKSFGDSSLDFEVVYYVMSSDYNEYMDIQEDINVRLLEAFNGRGIGFAYPTRTVYMQNAG